MDPSDAVFEQILTTWLPFEVDEDESRTIVDVLVNFVVKNPVPELLEKPNIRAQVLPLSSS